MGVEKVDSSDFIQAFGFYNGPYTSDAQTKYLINKESIKLMKPGVRIINCARGGIINEKDLDDAIVEGKVEGAALDVFEKEPPENNPLIALDNETCTPHLGASTKEAQENVAIAVAEQIVDLLCPRHDQKRGKLPFYSFRPGCPASALYYPCRKAWRICLTDVRRRRHRNNN